MSSRFIPIIKFSLQLEDCISSRLQVEPVLTSDGYGIEIKVILLCTGGTRGSKYNYERIIYSDILAQNSLKENDQFVETTHEYLEGLYYNKVTQDVAIPLTAVVLKTYFSELCDTIGLDLSDYFLEYSTPKVGMGYK